MSIAKILIGKSDKYCTCQYLFYSLHHALIRIDPNCHSRSGKLKEINPFSLWLIKGWWQVLKLHEDKESALFMAVFPEPRIVPDVGDQ